MVQGGSEFGTVAKHRQCSPEHCRGSVHRSPPWRDANVFRPHEGSGGEGSDGEEDQAWSYDGRRLPALNYSEQRIVEVKTWNEEIEKERVNAKAMKRKFSGVGLGYEDQPGAMLLDVWGEPMWKQDAGRWLNRRSRGREAVRDGPD